MKNEGLRICSHRHILSPFVSILANLPVDAINIGKTVYEYVINGQIYD